MDHCSCCGGPVGRLGGLGNLIHYQCRDCGAQFSEHASKEEEDEEQEVLATDETD